MHTATPLAGGLQSLLFGASKRVRGREESRRRSLFHGTSDTTRRIISPSRSSSGFESVSTCRVTKLFFMTEIVRRVYYASRNDCSEVDLYLVSLLTDDSSNFRFLINEGDDIFFVILKIIFLRLISYIVL